MATEKQIDANRRNAEKSTGPRTDEGKARSARNATRHGLLSQQVVLSDEDFALFGELRRNVQEDLRPGSQLEMLIVNRIVAQQWRLARIPILEAELFERLRYDATGADEGLGAAWARDAGPYGGALARLARYETTLERSTLRLLAELRRLQAERRKDEQAVWEDAAGRAAARDSRPWPERAAELWPGAPLATGPQTGGAGRPATQSAGAGSANLRNEANARPEGAAGAASLAGCADHPGGVVAGS